MSLITPSYFSRGECYIANLTQPNIEQDVQLAIDVYEPEYLKGLLGLTMYNQFASGLQASPIDQKWLDIRDGVQYQQDSYSGRSYEWQGLISSAIFSPATQTASEITYTTGAGGANPIAGQSSMSDSRLQNASYWIERKNSGTMEKGVDYDTSNNNATWRLLKQFDAFNDGEQFVIHFTKAGTRTDILPNYNSPIAYYVYWNYVRNMATTTTGTGEVAPQNQNSTLYGWTTKTDNAWNKMLRINRELYHFLRSKPDTYGTLWMQEAKRSFFEGNLNMFAL